MDYEKKYNELVERVKEFHEAGNALTKAQMEIILPELRESEKAKTKIAIIQFFRDAFNGKTRVINSNTFAEWADYLENKEEQKPTPDWMPKFLDELRSKKHYFDWDEHRDIEGHILAIINWIAPNYFNEKEKGQKSIEDAAKEVTKDKESAEKFLKTAGIVDENGNLAEIYRSEQEPAENGTRAKIISKATNEKQVVLLSESNGNEEIEWDTRSLKDTKKLLEHGIAFINKQLGTKSAEWSEEDIKKIRSEEYTKGFNDAAFGGKLKEWSEEDEGELQNAIDCLEYLGNGGVYASESGYDAAKNAVKFLKSLTERFNLQL